MNSVYSPGAQLGPYELLLPLSESGPAQAWVARLVGNGGFRAHVALKAIPRACFDDMPTEHLLLEQAALAARVHHPNLAQVLDLGEQDDALYVATEWVDGESLHALLVAEVSRGRMPLSIAVNLVGQLCRGLDAIHELKNAAGEPAHAVHGHVSPQNVLVSYNGTVKLSDFGIARVLDRLSFLSGPDEHNHKLTFAAPEQLSGGLVDRRADVFGVGVLLYLLTTSRHPFRASNVRATLHNICSAEAAPRPEALVDNYPAELSNIVVRALEKAPQARFESAAELMLALERALPTCFHSSCDQALAMYVDELCAAHRRELYGRIHAAEVRFNRVRTSMPAGRPSTTSSLRAVAIDGSALEPTRMSLRKASVGTRASQVATLKRVAAPAAALSGAFLLGIGLLLALGERPASRPVAAAGDPTAFPTISVRSLPVAHGPALKETAPAEAGNTAPTEAAPGPAPLPVQLISSLPLAARAAQRSATEIPRAAAPALKATNNRVPATRSAPAPAAQHSPDTANAPPVTKLALEAQSAPSPSEAEPRSKPAVNSWDPSTFGPRL